MDRPKVKKWVSPKSVQEYPMGSTCEGDHLVSINAGWRTFRPVIDNEKCVYCLRCFLVCPDGAIDKSNKILEIDYDYCKGCGICATECKFDAIEMIEEVK